MTAETARTTIIHSLSDRYGEGEASSIARIVLEDGFEIRPGAVSEAHIFSEDEQYRFSGILARLLYGEPVQYVLGTAHFFGYSYKVGPDVLIPRQETEELVAWVLDYLKKSGLNAPALLDIGLGSGCIGITLKARFPGIDLFGLEKSAWALVLAYENAQHILRNAPVHFVEGDILNPGDWAQFPLLDVVVSNPPYIPRQEENLMPDHVRKYEPGMALFVENDDPLLFYRVIADFAQVKLIPGGALFFECNEFNAGQVAGLLRDKGFADVQLRADLSGADRMIMARTN